MANEFKIFKGGGMDQDSSFSEIAGNDYISGTNIRVTGTEDSEEGDVTDIESSVAIPSPRKAGINLTLGSAKFETARKAYAVIYNSQGYNLITEYDFDTDTESVIFENLTSSDGVDIMPLNPDKAVGDIKLLQGNFLAFTDANSEPKIINLTRLKNSYYGAVKREDILLIKSPPIKEPKSQYANDEGRSANLIKRRLFQFIEQFEYIDYEFSAWSTRSKRSVPENEPAPTATTDVGVDNVIIASVDAGTDRVNKIKVGARYDLLDWFLIKDIEREYVVSLPNVEVDIENEIYEAYDPGTNVYSFAFYNDGNYPNIDVLETDLAYDAVSRKAESLEIINGKILALAGLTEGYPRPEIPVSLDVTYYKPQIDVKPTDQTNALKWIKTDSVRPSGSSQKIFTSYVSGLPKTGDKVTITTYNLNNISDKKVYTYTAVAGDNNNLNNFLFNLRNALSAQGAENVGSDSTAGTVRFRGISRHNFESFVIDLANVTTGETKSIRSIKTNSSYQLALAFRNEFGQYFPIQTGREFILPTLSLAQTSGSIPQFNWEILDPTAPEGAVDYQWLISNNNTHEFWLDVTASVKEGEGDSNFWEWNLNTLKDFNERNPSSILNYEYVEGDRITVIAVYKTDDSLFYYVNEPSIDLEVLGFDIVVDEEEETVDYVLKTSKASEGFNVPALNDLPVMIQIYRPKKRVITTDGVTTQTTNLWYEFGERFDIVDGQMTVLSGSITEADSFYKTREYTGVFDSNDIIQYQVESPDFSDYYKSDYSSYGRARTYDDEPGFIERKAQIRYSDIFQAGSKVNGINRFFPERLYGEGDGETSGDNGWIVKIRMRDSMLVCLQETKIEHIPVNISILEDQVAQLNVAISDRLLNKVRYLQSGKYGIGRAKESYAESQNGTIYFIDPNNSLPVRDGYDGVRTIAAKMTKFFRRVLQQSRQENKKVYGTYDDFNDEYYIIIENVGGVLTLGFSFTNENWETEEDFTVVPSTLLEVSELNGTVSINTTTGKAIFTPDEDFIGNANFRYSFVVAGQTRQKNECIEVIEGSIEVESFYFVDLINQPLSTLLVSNSALVLGINIAVPISIVGGEYQVNGGSWTSSPGEVNNNDVVYVRQNSSASFVTTTDTTLTIGGYSDTFSVTTKDATTPDPFSFTPILNADLATLYTSNTITISGISSASPISIVGGEYKINSGSWVSTAGTVDNGDTVQVRQTSSGSYNTLTTATLTVGGVNGAYNVTTKNPDVTPNPISFVPKLDAELTTSYESNSVTISGIDVNVPISIINGQYQINGGSWVSVPGSVANGDTVKVRRNSSNSYVTTVSTTLTVSSLSAVYNITTKSESGTFGNPLMSQAFTKDDCPSGQIGNSVTYTVAANTYTASTLDAAIALAQADIDANGQDYANTTGTCSVASTFTLEVVMYPSYANARYSNSDSRGVSFRFVDGPDIPVNYKASLLVPTSVIRNSVVSTFSVPFVGSSFPMNGVIAYPSMAATGSAAGQIRVYIDGVYFAQYTLSSTTSRPSGYQYQLLTYTGGSSVTITSSSLVRIEHGTAPAPTTYYSAVKTATATRNNCGSGGTGSSVSLSSTLGQFTSTVDQPTADAMAQAWVNANVQAYANANGTCTWSNDLQSDIATRNNCSSGGAGSTVTYTVNAGTYTSTISKTDANNQAIADVAANKQSYANSTGTCTWTNDPQSGSATKMGCEAGFEGTIVTYTVSAGSYSSTISKTDANNKAIADVAANKQAYANTNGNCVAAGNANIQYRINDSNILETNSFKYFYASGLHSVTTGTAYSDSTLYSFSTAIVAQTGVTLFEITYTTNTAGTSLNNIVKLYINGTLRGTSAPFNITDPSSIQVNITTASITVNATDTIYFELTPETFVFGNDERTGVAVKSCPSGYTGSTETYVVPANTYTAPTKGEANADAEQDVADNKQAYANSNGTCVSNITYYEAADSYALPRIISDSCSQELTPSAIYTTNSSGILNIGDTIYVRVYSEEYNDYIYTPISVDPLETLYISYFQGSVRYIASSDGTFSFVLDTKTACENCPFKLTFNVVANGSTQANVTVNTSGGTAPYTYLWSNGQTTQTATGLNRDEEYTVSVFDSAGCIASSVVTPNVEVTKGLSIELLYFRFQTSTGMYPNRLCTGDHECNRATFRILANTIDIGQLSVSNDGADGRDFRNYPPGWPSYNAYSNFDRYDKLTISRSQASQLTVGTGKISIKLQYVPWMGTSPHSESSWLRILSETGTVLVSTCMNSFSEYIFDPYDV